MLIDKRYFVEKLIGEGGSSRVYRVLDKVSGRVLALKQLQVENYSDEDRFSFEQEFLRLKKLAHPNIIKVYDYGFAENAQPYFTMNYYPLGNFARWWQGRSDIDLFVKLIVDVLSALQYLHEQGVLFRDLKPANILIEEKDGEFRAVLSDFGLAQEFLEGTQNSRAGSYHYVSPEAIRNWQLDPRSDLYSLGATMFELLAGRPVFEKESVRDVLLAHLNEKPERVRKFNQIVPFQLDDLIQKLLSKKPEERFRSAAEVVEEINRFKFVSRKYHLPDKLVRLWSGSFVGRNEVVEEMHRLADEASREGALRTFVIQGDHGVGKTRIVREFVTRRQVLGNGVFWFSCSDFHDVPNGLILELLRAVGVTVRMEEIELTAEEEEFWRFLLIHSEKNWDVSIRFNDITHFFDICLDLFKKFVAASVEENRTPLIFVFDDLQEASLQAMEFLRYLVYRAQDLPLFVVIDYTHLKQEGAEEVVSALAGEDFGRFYHVEPLTPQHTRALVRSKIELQSDDPEFYEFIHRYSGGNPLLIEQLLTYLVEEKALVCEPEGWIWVDREYPERAPEGLDELLGMKFQAFSPEQRNLLQVMAVYGESVPHNLLAFYWQDEPTELYELFRQLKSSNLLGLSVIDGQKYYRFLQTSWQQFLVRNTPEEVRAELHRKWYELIALMREDLESDYLVRATLHALRGGLIEEFLSFAPEAIDYSLKVFDYEQALNLIREYLHHVGDQEPEQTLAILKKQAKVFEARGDFAGAEAVLQDILARKDFFSLSPDEEFSLSIWLASILQKKGETHAAIRTLEAWQERLEEFPHGLRGNFYSELGWLYRITGQYAEALRLLDLAEQNFLQADLPRELGKVYNRMGVTHMVSGDLETANQFFRKALRIFQQEEDLLGQAHVYNNLGILASRRNELQLALQHYSFCLNKMKMLRDYTRVPFVYNNIANIHYYRGAWDEAYQSYRQSLQVSQGLGIVENSARVLTNIGRLLFYRGEFERARTFVSRALRLMRKSRDLYGMANALETMGDILFGMEQLDRARRYFLRSVRYYETHGHRAEEASCLTRLAYLQLAEKDLSGAEQSLSRAEHLCDEEKQKEQLAKIAILRLKKACLEFNQEEMDQAYQRLLQYLDHLRDPFDLGLAHRHLGWYLFYKEKYRRAQEAAQQSLDIFDKLDVPREKIATLKLFAQIALVKGDSLAALGYLKRAATLAEPLPIRNEKLQLYRRISEIQERLLAEQMSRMDTQEGLRAIQQTNLIVHSLFDLEVLLQNIMNMAINLLKADKGAILMLPDEGGDLEVKVSREMESATLADAYRLSRSIIEEVGRTGQSILASHAPDDERLRGSESVRQFHIFSLMCVPIRLDDRILGTVYVDSRNPERVFDHRDLEFLENIAELAAVAIGNSEYFHELENRKRELENQLADLQAQLQAQASHLQVVGKSPAMRKIFHTISKILDKDIDVLIRGESGTGKEMIAALIHYNSSRKEKPFVKVNCAAIPQTLLESELFGIEKRVATGVDMHRGKFEQADGGTIFLDEIGDMALETQAKILRVIQEREFQRIGGEETIRVDVRIIAATNKNLEEAIKEGKFREDLFYRLNVLPIEIPPLRERKEDIPLLVEHFMEKYQVGGKKKRITDAALRQLIAYDWPGNVRELENLIQRLLIFTEGDVIRVYDLPEEIRSFSGLPPQFKSQLSPDGLKNYEKAFLEKALRDHDWNISKTAKVLGIHRNTLSRKMKRLGIPSRRP